jgi:hypothetical protein
VNCIHKFIPIAYTKTEDKDVVLEDFLGLYEFMISRGELEAHVFETYLDLANFVWSWRDYMNNKGIPLVGKDYISPSSWRLDLGRASSK